MKTENERITRLESRDEQWEKDICALFNEIREMKDKLIQRPSWLVTFLLSGLMTLSVSLIIIILK